jgi:hypothetical protein
LERTKKIFREEYCELVCVCVCVCQTRNIITTKYLLSFLCTIPVSLQSCD